MVVRLAVFVIDCSLVGVGASHARVCAVQRDIDVGQRSGEWGTFHPVQDLRRKVLRECHGLLYLKGFFLVRRRGPLITAAV